MILQKKICHPPELKQWISDKAAMLSAGMSAFSEYVTKGSAAGGDVFM